MSKIVNYSEVSKSYDSTRGASEAFVLKGLMENFTGKTVNEMDMVDIGCGTGNYADYFLQFEPRSLSLMDASEGMLAKAKAKLPSNHPKTRLSFKQALLPDMPYEDNRFDAAMINLVLHHLEKNPDGKSFPEILKTLKGAYRILKPGGVLTIMTMTPKQMGACWFINFVPENKERWLKRFLSHSQLKTCLEEAGFTLKSAFTTLIPSHFPGFDNPESVLNESWRKNLSFWDTCSESEVQELIQIVTRMKNEGALQEFYEKHNEIDTFGGSEILAARKDIK